MVELLPYCPHPYTRVHILGCCNVNPQYEYPVAQGFCKDKMMHNIYQWFNGKIDIEEVHLY